MANNYDDSSYDLSNGYTPELRSKLISAALFIDNKIHNEINNDLYFAFVKRVFEEILMKLQNVQLNSREYPHARPALELIIERITDFVGDGEVPVYRPGFLEEIDYYLEIADKLDRINFFDHDIKIFTPVDEALIYMNYNSKSYIKLLEAWLTEQINKAGDPMEKLHAMHLYHKAFAQLHRKPDVALHKDYIPLKEVLQNWFVHETQYLDNELNLWVRTLELPIVQQKKTSPEERIKWNLSSDQLALLIRAVDDTRVIQAKSMNAVFKAVIPYFSTEHKEVLSASAVRARSYIAEQSDKDVVIQALEKIIKRIREY